MYRIILVFFIGLQTLLVQATDKSVSALQLISENNEPHKAEIKITKIYYSFEVSVKDTSLQLFHVRLSCTSNGFDTLDFRMANWTPGYYQMMHYANNLQQFNVSDLVGHPLKWLKSGENIWKVFPGGNKKIIIEYDIIAKHRFVAGNYLDATMGYISPAGVFIYPFNKLNQPVTVTVKPFGSWTVATGMENDLNSSGKNDHNKGSNIFYADNFDILFDSPILLGNIETFPSFKIKGIPHYFKAVKAGVFDRQIFMNDLGKMVEAASNIIGDIPYSHYCFLAMGPGGGGIEHLNSASIAFNGEEMNKREGKIRTMNFLAHEYFHHYNVKRIRPVELGPFDYENGSRTSMLWFSEGFTVYYEYLILKRAGITAEDEMLESFRQSIQSFLNKEGRKYQSPADASLQTWDEGPFGRTQDKINKTISVYDKGALLGIILDFKIRHETGNKKSLDDLMRLLYNKYYKKMGRGFTASEFRTEAENMAGVPLDDFFDQVNTVKEINYNTYLEYGGIRMEVSDVSAPDENGTQKRNFVLSKMEHMDAMQQSIYKSWMGN